MERVNLEPGFVLHTRPYSNTSLILDLLTQKHGRISAIARSARGPKSRFRGKLQLFTPMLISWSGRAELKHVNAVELHASAYQLNHTELLCAFYVNELLTHLLQKEDPCPKVFSLYEKLLHDVQHPDNLQTVLRYFEKNLLDVLGYGLPLEHEANTRRPIDTQLSYQYIPEHGFVICERHDMGLIISGESLFQFQQESLNGEENQREIKRLMRMVIARHLNGRSLKSREMLK